MGSFVHLHVHSEFSLLDGLARLGELCQQTKALGMDALALTDHGQMYGMIKFDRAAKAAGIKPIFGCEVYMAPRRLTDRDPKRYHLILLAENDQGYSNLLKLVTIANLKGFYHRPRIDRELLAEYSEGLICLSACISGQVPSLVREGRIDEARRAIAWFKSIFGPDRYFIELQRHDGIPELQQVNAQLVSLAKEFGLRCVATNDVHYVRAEDAEIQEVLLALQTNTTLSDPNRMRMGSDDYYLMSPQEMAQRFPEYPEALENTCMIAERCNVDLGFKGYHLPKFPVPKPHTAESYLRELCEQGLHRRYREITPEIRARLEHELKIIHDMGFDDYFLINEDLVRWAKQEAKMLVGPGRGSGASSLVSYVLGITDLEPLQLGLIFERFLNPGRITMPDLDLDYPEDRRQEVIEYLTHRYGADKTAQIATFGSMLARSAVRDVGRAMGLEPSEVDHVAKLIPSGSKWTIQDALEEVTELRDLYETAPHIKKLIDYSIALQGIARHVSTHAAGVLIADRPLVEYTPLQRAPKGEGIISQFSMTDVEEIGLLKLDVLGLSTLTVIDRTLKWIERTTGETLRPESIPLDDPETFALLASGEVTGIFQVESAGMRRVLRDMQPTDFTDIIAVLGLYRPGPMQYIRTYIDRKKGREPVTYPHPSLEPILAETYGIIVYQEQVIQIASQLAGFSPSEADLMRRAMGKKKAEVLEQQHIKFIEGCVQNGIPQETAEAIFRDIEAFANYGFNKSHGAAYAVITLQTAYLKRHYPVEFMTALLSVERGNPEKVGYYIGECRRLGIPVRPPDVRCSDIDFIIEPVEKKPSEPCQELAGKDLAIRFGLGAIKNVGDGPAEIIVQARGDRPFANINDFIERVDLRKINKRVLECLIRAGALDSLGERQALLAAVDQMIAVSASTHKARDVGQRSIFDLLDETQKGMNGAGFSLPENIPPISEKRRLADEKELLGCYMSSHPLDILSQYVDDRLVPLAEIDESLAGQEIQVAGVFDSVRVITTRTKGDLMAFARLEDLSGTREVVIFPSVYASASETLQDGTPKLIKARVDMRKQEPSLVAESIEPYRIPKRVAGRKPTAREAKKLTVDIPLDGEAPDPEILERVLALLGQYKGAIPLTFLLHNRQGKVEIEFPEIKIRYSHQLEEEIGTMLGRGRLLVQWA